MALLQILRPTLPILIGASLMLTLSMGLRQSFGIFMQPLTHDIGISVSQFTLALAVQNLAWGFLQPVAGAMTVRYGFMNEPDISQTLEIAGTLGLEFDMMSTSFFLSRETVVPVALADSGMAFWREKLFAMMSRNSGNAADYFKLPANRVIELGTKVEI